MSGNKLRRFGVLPIVVALVGSFMLAMFATSPAYAWKWQRETIKFRNMTGKATAADTSGWVDSTFVHHVSATTDTSAAFTLPGWVRWETKKNQGAVATGYDSSLAFIYVYRTTNNPTYANAMDDSIYVKLETSLSGDPNGAWEAVWQGYRGMVGKMGDGFAIPVNTIDSTFIWEAVSLGNKIAFPQVEFFRVITQTGGTGEFTQEIIYAKQEEGLPPREGFGSD